LQKSSNGVQSRKNDSDLLLDSTQISNDFNHQVADVIKESLPNINYSYLAEAIHEAAVNILPAKKLLR